MSTNDKCPLIAAKSPSKLELEPGTYHWCACGHSKSQPFCDGSHAGTGMCPQKIEITQKRQVALCNCKHSKNPPFCDGTHIDF